MLHGTCVGEVYGLIKGAFAAQELSQSLHAKHRIDEGKVALLHGTCAGEVYGLKGVSLRLKALTGLAIGAYGTIDKGKVALVDNRRRLGSIFGL